MAVFQSLVLLQLLVSTFVISITGAVVSEDEFDTIVKSCPLRHPAAYMKCSNICSQHLNSTCIDDEICSCFPDGIRSQAPNPSRPFDHFGINQTAANCNESPGCQELCEGWRKGPEEKVAKQSLLCHIDILGYGKTQMCVCAL